MRSVSGFQNRQADVAHRLLVGLVRRAAVATGEAYAVAEMIPRSTLGLVILGVVVFVVLVLIFFMQTSISSGGY
jgi:hypothetical protein